MVTYLWLNDLAYDGVGMGNDWLGLLLKHVISE